MKINGTLEAKLTGEQLSFRPFDGGTVGGVYEGHYIAVAALIDPLKNQGFSVDYQRQGSVLAKLSFSAGYSSSSAPTPNQDFQDVWELVRNSAQKELLQSDHPLIAQVTDIVSPDAPEGFTNPELNGNLTFLKSLFANPSLVNNPDFTLSGDGPDSMFAAKYLWDMWMAGEKSLEVKQPILRLTRTTNPFYDTPFSVANIDTILTTASMMADSGVPNSFAVPLVNLADRLMEKSPLVPGTTEQSRADSLALFFGWKKNLVSSTKYGSKRIQYILEYQFGLWDSETYGEPQ